MSLAFVAPSVLDYLSVPWVALNLRQMTNPLKLLLVAHSKEAHSIMQENHSPHP